MNKLDEIEASMEAARAYAASGPEHRAHGRQQATEQLVALARYLGGLTEDADVIVQVTRIVDVHDSF